MPELNTALATKTLDLIEAHQNAFEMAEWITGPDRRKGVVLEDIVNNPSCTTTLCAAGFATIAAGNKLVMAQGIIRAISPSGEPLDLEEIDLPYEMKQTDMMPHGAKLLGIKVYEAMVLFQSDNLEAIRALRLIAAGDEDWFETVFPDSYIDKDEYDEYEDDE